MISIISLQLNQYFFNWRFILITSLQLNSTNIWNALSSFCRLFARSIVAWQPVELPPKHRPYTSVPVTRRQNPHNWPHSDDSRGQGGGVQTHREPHDNPYNEQGQSFELSWFDIVLATSVAILPERRMHILWCVAHPPEDYISHLSGRGYVGEKFETKVVEMSKICNEQSYVSFFN